MARVDNNYFTYRESPATENGTGTFESIKGNTINWNQLAENGNFADGIGNWSTGGANTLTVTDGVCKIKSTNTSTSNHHLVFPDPSIFQNGHKYLVRCQARAYGNMIGGSIFLAQQVNYINIGTFVGLEELTSAWKSGYLVFSRNDMTLTNGKRIVIGNLTTVTTDDYFELKDICVFDLTQMGLDSLTAEDFTSLFPLPYYQYDSGSLLSFNGTGIKTVGKNIYNLESPSVTAAGITLVNNGDGTYRMYGTATAQQDFRFRTGNDAMYLDGGDYYYSGITGGSGSTYKLYAQIHEDGKSTRYNSVNGGDGFIQMERGTFILFVRVYSGATIDITVKPMLRYASVTDGTFEPYTSSTTSLPISTYFPTGLKSVPNAYDELTQSKAIARIDRVLMQNMQWNMISSGVFASGLSVAPPSWTRDGTGALMSPLYTEESWNSIDRGTYTDKSIHALLLNNYLNIRVYDSSCTTLEQFTSKITDVPLQYEMTSPTEQDIDIDLTYPIDKGGTEELLPSSLLNGVVDLGSLTWTKVSGYPEFRAIFANNPNWDIKPASSGSVIGNIFCPNYETLTNNDTYRGNSKGISIGTSYVSVGDSAYTDLETFVSAMSDVYLYYEKSSSTPYTSPILADIFYRGMIPVSVTVYPLGAGTVTGAGQYRYHETVTLEAESNDGIYRFLRYEDENGDTLSTNPIYSFEAGE